MKIPREVKALIRKCLGFILVWFCSGIALVSYQNGYISVGIIATIVSVLYFWVVN